MKIKRPVGVKVEFARGVGDASRGVLHAGGNIPVRAGFEHWRVLIAFKRVGHLPFDHHTVVGAGMGANG